MHKDTFRAAHPNEKPIGKRRVTRDMVNTRTCELATIAGRSAANIKQADYERAKYELTGESDRDRQAAILDSTPTATHQKDVPAPNTSDEP